MSEETRKYFLVYMYASGVALAVDATGQENDVEFYVDHSGMRGNGWIVAVMGTHAISKEIAERKMYDAFTAG